MDTNGTITDFLHRHLGPYDGIAHLSGYASTRNYRRVSSQKKSYILCHDPELIESPAGEYSFAIVHRLFKAAGVPVPEIYAMERDTGLLLLEDLGDLLLEAALRGLDGASADDVYDSVFDCLMLIQNIRGKEKIPFGLHFDVEKLMYEFNFFMEHALQGYFGVVLSERDSKALTDEFMKIAGMLHRPEIFVLNHRDFHSRNIILRRNEPHIVDFQHARMGLPQYDLASLLCDDYTFITQERSDSLKARYFRMSKEKGLHAMSVDEFDRLFDMMAFQRSVKALGTFGFQIMQRHNLFYKPYMKNTMRYIPRSAGRREELKRAFSLMQPIFEEGR